MTGGHAHGRAAPRAGARYRRRLGWSLALVGVFFVVEATAGVLANSLALLSDAGHMLTDVGGLGMAVAAIHVADRADRADQAGRRPDRTFGLYRLEILAALANAVALFGIAGYVLWEAARRLADPSDVSGGPMLVVAGLGLAVNLVVFALLRPGAAESLNVKGAYVEVVADTLGSVGVIVAAVVYSATGWTYVDPIVGAGIGLFILPRAWRLGAQAVRILVQAAPAGVDLGAVEADLAAIPGVVDVHDLHLWTLTSDMDVASAHLMVGTGANAHGVLDSARELLRDRYRVAHATLQVEPDDHEGCDELRW